MADQFVRGYTLTLSTSQTIQVAKGSVFLSANATSGPLPVIRLLAMVESGDKQENREIEVQPTNSAFRTPEGFQRRFISAVDIYGMTFSVFELIASPAKI